MSQQQKKNKYFIGTNGFQTKGSCLEYTRGIVNSLGRGILDKNHSQFTFLCDLIQNHPDSGDKIGVGIKHFIVIANYSNKSRNHLSIMRLDDSEDNFSWVYCCKFNKRTQLSKISVLFRCAIINDIKIFRNSSELKCCICKTEDTSKIYHTDHFNPSFAILRDNFLKITTKPMPTSSNQCPIYYTSTFKKEDYELEQEWVEYHNKHCNLQILCSKCNITKEREK